ncbi:hypothetical protein SALBM311S_02783 [Streptomyces alboniger]
MADEGTGFETARVPQQRTEQNSGELRLVADEAPALSADDTGATALLEVVGQDRARAAGELRADVSVADVLLVIATAAPSLPGNCTAGGGLVAAAGHPAGGPALAACLMN